MSSGLNTLGEFRVHRQWRDDPGLLAAVRDLFTYGPGEDRAAGYIYSADDGQAWPAGFAEYGPALLDELERTLGVRFTIALFQAYRDGSGCGWHADDAFDAQAILSLGTTRTFGIRRNADLSREWMPVQDGDLVFMPSGFQREWQHCVPVEHVTGERCSLVFRTVVRS